jgi:hypothetical protein
MDSDTMRQPVVHQAFQVELYDTSRQDSTTFVQLEESHLMVASYLYWWSSLEAPRAIKDMVETCSIRHTDHAMAAGIAWPKSILPFPDSSDVENIQFINRTTSDE